jgi:hypothetical protein
MDGHRRRVGNWDLQVSARAAVAAMAGFQQNEGEQQNERQEIFPVSHCNGYLISFKNNHFKNGRHRLLLQMEAV